MASTLRTSLTGRSTGTPMLRMSARCLGVRVMKSTGPPSIVPAIIVFLISWGLLLAILGGAVCSDGWTSGSIGKSGACSHHGGVNKLPNLLAFIASMFVAVKLHSFRSRGYKKHNEGNFEAQSVVAAPPKSLPVKSRKKKHVSHDSTLCPNCQSPMVARTARKGHNAGGQFWGCRKFPKCKGTRPFEASKKSET